MFVCVVLFVFLIVWFMCVVLFVVVVVGKGGGVKVDDVVDEYVWWCVCYVLFEEKMVK